MASNELEYMRENMKENNQFQEKFRASSWWCFYMNANLSELKIFSEQQMWLSLNLLPKFQIIKMSLTPKSWIHFPQLQHSYTSHLYQ